MYADEDGKINFNDYITREHFLSIVQDDIRNNRKVQLKSNKIRAALKHELFNIMGEKSIEDVEIITEGIVEVYNAATDYDKTIEEIEKELSRTWSGNTTYSQKVEKKNKTIAEKIYIKMQELLSQGKTSAEVIGTILLLYKQSFEYELLTSNAELVHFHSIGRRDEMLLAGDRTALWNALPGACDLCADKDGMEVDLLQDELPPEHPHCMCYLTKVKN